jgi:pimeloyl-ACP methyl ester carboxylesterase
MSSFTTADGARLHYEIEGDGPPLILQLGAGCDADFWRAAGYVDALSKNRSCVLFDHRGNGKSAHPRGAGANHIDRHVDDLVTLVETLGNSTVSYFGWWSNGVAVGLKAAEHHPQLFEALVLFGPIALQTSPEKLEAGSWKLR